MQFNKEDMCSFSHEITVVSYEDNCIQRLKEFFLIANDDLINRLKGFAGFMGGKISYANRAFKI